MNHLSITTMTIFLALGALTVSPASAQSFAIRAHSINAGGGVSTSPSYTLRSVIGQHGVGTLSGSSFTLKSGFLPTTVRRPACLPDLTGDGDLNFFDVSAFLTAFNSQDDVADFNSDGSWNFFDVSAFLSAFIAGCP